MKTRLLHRMITMLLICSMMLSILPLSALAVKGENTGTSDTNPTDLQYSQEKYVLELAGTLSEPEGSGTITLSRSTNLDREAEVTLLVYDKSAVMGEDYTLSFQEKVIEKIPNSTSIYEAFETKGELMDGFAMEMTLALDRADQQSNADRNEELSAAEKLKQLDELQVCAARIPVAFAAEQSELELSVQVLDDTSSEYAEDFFVMVLDSQGELVEDAMVVCTITDNEEPPTVQVEFGSEPEIRLEGEDLGAELAFLRTGDLATTTVVVVQKNGEMFCKVAFVPGQEIQTVSPVEAGVYTLLDEALNPLEGQQVTVIDERPTTMSVASGADPELDAVPDSYAPLPYEPNVATAPGSWMPSWADHGSWSSEDTIVIAGTLKKNLYKQGGLSGKGRVTMYANDGNFHLMDTTGTGSRLRKGHAYLDSIDKYDLTGVASISMTFHCDDVDHDTCLSLGFNDGSDHRVRRYVKENTTVDVSCPVPAQYQGKAYIFCQNRDYIDQYGGTEVCIPNAIKFDLRQYGFIIEDDPNLVKALDYTNGPTPGTHSPTISANNKFQFATIKTKEHGENKKIMICYNTDSGYPARLVGYKLHNSRKNITSDVIALTGTMDGLTGEGGFVFDEAFLKKYEKDYAVEKDINGVMAWTFQIIPVYEKIPVEYELRSFDGKTIKIENKENLYIGDKLVLSSDSEGLAGIWYQEKSDTGNDIKNQYISETTYDGKPGKYVVELKYPRYIFQGVFSQDAAKLTVDFGAVKGHGKLAHDPGVWVDKKEYTAGEYYPLTAAADQGYVTQWSNRGNFYYGNVFHYQLDGHPEHNAVRVQFLPDKTEKATLSGTVTAAYVNLRVKGEKTDLPAANVELTIHSDKVYKAVTDKNGHFEIPDFVGVKNGTYSVSVTDKNGITYDTFQYLGQGDHTYEIKLPQFPDSSAYPEQVSASVNGQGMSSNTLDLLQNGNLLVNIQVYEPPKNCKVTEVNVYFLDPTKAESQIVSPSSALVAKLAVDMGSTQIWQASIESSGLPSGSHIYVEVKSEKTVHGKNGEEQVTISSGLADGGYTLITPAREDVVSEHYEVPELPGMINAKGMPLADLNIPLLGTLDFGVSTNSGGFFTQRTNPDGTWTLICGQSYLKNFATGTTAEKLAIARATRDAVAAKMNSKNPSNKPKGGAEPDIGAARPGEPDPGSPKKAPTNLKINPAYLFSLTMDQGKTEVKEMEIALGVDLSYTRNFPFNVSGIPMYIRVNFTSELYYQMQVDIENAPDLYKEGDVRDFFFPKGGYEPVCGMENFIIAPFMQMGVRGGVGFTGFAGAYVEGLVKVPFIISITPLDAAANLSYDVAAGAEIVVFDFKLDAKRNPIWIGDETMAADLNQVISPMMSTNSLDFAGQEEEQLQSAESFEAAWQQGTFKPMERNVIRRSGTAESTIAADVFKNTRVQLYHVGKNTVVAFFIADHGTEEETLNYLSAMYAVSQDGGTTWSAPAFISENGQTAPTSLQYDIKFFHLQDRSLVTWSEANFDQVLAGLKNVDLNHLTLRQIAACMNAMSLKGRFMDQNGAPMGEPFLISDQHSTVCCGALDAVQNGNQLYVYYQRNRYDMDENSTLTDLINQERTIAMAYTTIDGAQVGEWNTKPVRALNENGQQHRITEVVPFVHDGVLGEIAVLDQDGKLALWNANTESWDPSIEDRQMFLRTYELDAKTGEPVPTALMAITDPTACAQHPEVVSNQEDLHLLWNQDGKVVYTTDFVASASDSEAVQKAAYVLVKQDETVRQNEGIYNAFDLTSSDSFHVGTEFTASMSEDGKVLVSWIAPERVEVHSLEELETTDPLETDQIYGAMFETLTNKEADDRFAKDTGDEEKAGSSDLKQLYALGLPVKLTDVQNSLIGSLDSLCLTTADRDFLLAYTKLNSSMRSTATSADILTLTREKKPELVIEEIDAPAYPTPGSKIEIAVDVANEGLEAAENISVELTGLGTVTANIPSLLPGTSRTVVLTLEIPADFRQNTAMTVTAGEAKSTFDLLYGPYFVMDEMPIVRNIPETMNGWVDAAVQNIGNAPGAPNIHYQADRFAENDTPVQAEYTSDVEIQPGAGQTVSYLWEDTLFSETDSINLLVSVGDNPDQQQTGRMPKPAVPMNNVEIKEQERPSVPPTEGETTREELPDGTIVETTKKPDGSQVIKVQKPDGSVGLIEKDQDGRTQAKTTVSEKALKEAEKAEKPAKLPLLPVYVPDHPKHGPTIEIQLENRDEARVTIPVENMEPGVVPVRINRDGTEEIVRKSSVSETGVTLEVESGETIKLIKITKEFTDVRNHWAADAIDFATSRGLYQGTSETTFSPDLGMTRGMLAVVLHNLESNPAAALQDSFLDVDSGSWYQKAVYWAAKEGIVTGYDAQTFGPNDGITREQLAVMLYRYLGEPKVTGTITGFRDADRISAYAVEAMTWAVEKGILNGIAPGRLEPQGYATRAQVATMLMRFLAL